LAAIVNGVWLWTKIAGADDQRNKRESAHCLSRSLASSERIVGKQEAIHMSVLSPTRGYGSVTTV